MEVEALVSSSTICRRHGALQESLASVTYLSDIVPDCKAVGLDIEATAQHEVANVLWEQGETEISIRMRQHLIEHADFDSQNTDLSLPVLLARLVSTTLYLVSRPLLTLTGSSPCGSTSCEARCDHARLS
jgi:ataxia telangiectasia mutated family protein